MKFVLVNGRTPRPQSSCALCCEPVGGSYLREFAIRLSYCDHNGYADHRKAADEAGKKASEAVMTIVGASRCLPYLEEVMPHPQIRKRQACDRCDGRFGLIMHRWWANKFCKKVCGDAHVHEIVLDRDAIRRWFGFAHAPLRARAVSGSALCVE